MRCEGFSTLSAMLAMSSIVKVRGFDASGGGSVPSSRPVRKPPCCRAQIVKLTTGSSDAW